MVFPSRIQDGFCVCMCKEERNNRDRKRVRQRQRERGIHGKKGRKERD